MNKIILSTLALAATVTIGTAAVAQQKMDDMKTMEMAKQGASSAQATHKATGVVKKANAKAGLVTLAHGPVKSLNWPAMTMGFEVKDKMLFNKLVVGKKVEFEFVQGSKGYVVTAVK